MASSATERNKHHPADEKKGSPNTAQDKRTYAVIAARTLNGVTHRIIQEKISKDEEAIHWSCQQGNKITYLMSQKFKNSDIPQFFLLADKVLIIRKEEVSVYNYEGLLIRIINNPARSTKTAFYSCSANANRLYFVSERAFQMLTINLWCIGTGKHLGQADIPGSTTFTNISALSDGNAILRSCLYLGGEIKIYFLHLNKDKLTFNLVHAENTDGIFLREIAKDTVVFLDNNELKLCAAFSLTPKESSSDHLLVYKQGFPLPAGMKRMNVFMQPSGHIATTILYNTSSDNNDNDGLRILYQTSDYDFILQKVNGHKNFLIKQCSIPKDILPLNQQPDDSSGIIFFDDGSWIDEPTSNITPILLNFNFILPRLFAIVCEYLFVDIENSLRYFPTPFSSAALPVIALNTEEMTKLIEYMLKSLRSTDKFPPDKMSDTNKSEGLLDALTDTAYTFSSLFLGEKAATYWQQKKDLIAKLEKLLIQIKSNKDQDKSTAELINCINDMMSLRHRILANQSYRGRYAISLTEMLHCTSYQDLFGRGLPEKIGIRELQFLISSTGCSTVVVLTAIPDEKHIHRRSSHDAGDSKSNTSSTAASFFPPALPAPLHKSPSAPKLLAHARKSALVADNKNNPQPAPARPRANTR